MPSLASLIGEAFPNSDLCAAFGQHIGPPTDSFCEELSDDRNELLVVPRCSTCGMPCGADREPTEAERAQFYATL